jgi:hypothetical protein
MTSEIPPSWTKTSGLRRCIGGAVGTLKRKQNVVRVSVSVSKPNLEWMKQEAERLGISTSELFRRVIDEAKQRQLMLRVG